MKNYWIPVTAVFALYFLVAAIGSHGKPEFWPLVCAASGHGCWCIAESQRAKGQ